MMQISPKALERVESDHLLAQVYALEPTELESLIDIARVHCSDPSERWENYEMLKKSVRRLVGFDAKHPELSTNQHYEVLLAFIDWLLPGEVTQC
jgi:hypothetical protein